MNIGYDSLCRLPWIKRSMCHVDTDVTVGHVLH